MPETTLRITRRIVDDPYAWTAAYRAVVAPDRVALTLRLQLRPGPEVTGADLARVHRETVEAVAHYYRPRFTLGEVGDGGVQRPMHVGLEFVTSDPDLPVTVHVGSGRDNLQHWFVNSGVAARAHELGHAFGLKDEYPDRLVTNRATLDSMRVYRDHSLMGDFHREGAQEAEIKLRHVADIAHAVGASLGRGFSVAPVEGLAPAAEAPGAGRVAHDVSTGQNAFSIKSLRELAQRDAVRPAGDDHLRRLRR